MNSATTLHLVFTMNCLPPGDHADIPGPRSWEEAREATRNCARTLSDLSLAGTFFVETEAAAELVETVREYGGRQAETGLLCHPQLHGYQNCLGSYRMDRQREIINLVATGWENRVGRRPAAFRPGFFSANDYTYQVLCLEGFTEGSCSLPGKVDLDRCTRWDNTFPFPHHTDPLDRRASGTMEFFEVPVSSDFEATGQTDSEMFIPHYLRIEQGSATEQETQLVRSLLERMEQEKMRVRVLTFVTSNRSGWDEHQNALAKRVEKLVKITENAAREYDLEVSSTTLADIHAHADEVWNGRETLNGAE